MVIISPVLCVFLNLPLFINKIFLNKSFYFYYYVIFIFVSLYIYNIHKIINILNK